MRIVGGCICSLIYFWEAEGRGTAVKQILCIILEAYYPFVKIVTATSVSASWTF